MNQSESTKEIFTALAAAQAAFKPAVKDALNPHFKKRYADLAAVWEAVREPLSQNGLSIVQEAISGERGVGVTTQINHISGEWVRLGPLMVPLEKPNAHGTGSAISYGKRYGLAAALGIVAEDDDDGNEASAAPASKAAAKPAPATGSKENGTEGNPAKARLVAILKEEIGCPRDRGPELFDAVTAGKFLPGDMDDPLKAVEILGLFQQTAEAIPYGRMMAEIDELRNVAGAAALDDFASKAL